jgi:uncharacterized protein
MELEEVARVVSRWARTKPIVRRAYLFGSRVRGEHRVDSDIDIAVELEPNLDESGGLATWMFEKEKWKEELQGLIPLEIQLERYHPEQTPTVGKGIGRSSQIVYEK